MTVASLKPAGHRLRFVDAANMKGMDPVQGFPFNLSRQIRGRGRQASRVTSLTRVNEKRPRIPQYLACLNTRYRGKEGTMLVLKIMSCPVISVTTTTTLIEAADSMRLHEVGALPVFHSSVPLFGGSDGIEGTIIAGIVTDRDIVIRGLAHPRSGFDWDMRVTAIMGRVSKVVEILRRRPPNGLIGA